MNKVVFIVLFWAQVAFSETILLVGDTGKDNVGQKAVADAMYNLCQEESCDQVFLLGDNVYGEGIKSPLDPLMDRMFKKHYEKLKIPFRVILGNHDHGKWSNDWSRGAAQVAYSKINPQFGLPHEYYSFETDHLVVAALDTSRLMWSKDFEEQGKMVSEAYALAQKTNKWFVVMGHHPYISNGKHGNAGKYEGIGIIGPVSGSDVKKFIERFVCGKATLYLSGHDHNLQVLDANQKKCKTLQVVSGAGASIEEWRERNQLLFGALELGYFKMTVQASLIEITAMDANNQDLFAMTLAK